ncbi:MAG: LacI family DNA-binding transcriptional regulator [Lachnospiraceae bacterium]|nr:LacI family DNA-binding transcriptional regulator [Lachnospiraceae bacterium]
MQTITIKDIAKICGVGVSTVSRALNDHPDINAATKEKILQTVAEYHFVPNNSARNIRITDSKTIAVLVKGISNPFFMKMIRIMENEICMKGYSMTLHHVDNDTDETAVAMELITEKRLRGIIFLGGHFNHTVERLDAIPVPFVLSTIAVPEELPKRYSFVSVNDVEESYKLVEYLLRLGHTRIAMITAGETDESIGKLRKTGYLKALRDHGIDPDPALIYEMDPAYDPYTMENGYAVMQKILAAGHDFTAVYAISDTLAVGAAKALSEAGYRIPADVSLAGFDGIDLAQYYIPSITTVRQPFEEMAQMTVSALFQEMEQTGKFTRKLFAGTLIEGGSCAPLS